MNRITIAALALVAVATPALAQEARIDSENAAMAARLARSPLKSRAYPAYTGRVNVDPATDAWRPISQQEMQRVVFDPALKQKSYSLSARIDYDGDGRPDVAQLVNNSRQGAVLVTLGGSGRQVVAFKMDSRFLGGEELYAVGRNRLMVNFPELGVAMLGYEGGRPTVRRLGD